MDQDQNLENIENSELADEIAAINAIYGENTITVTSATGTGNNAAPFTLDLAAGRETTANNVITTVTRLQIPNHDDLSFMVGFEGQYPETAPHILGTATTAARGQGKKDKAILEDIVKRIHQAGSVCLFEVISDAVEVFDSREEEGDEDGNNNSNTTTTTTTTTTNNGKHEDDNDEEGGGEDKKIGNSEKEITTNNNNYYQTEPPDWTLSDVVSDRKSVFLGWAAPVTSVEQAQFYVQHLLSSDKKVAVATHNISAWRINQPQSENSTTPLIFQDFDDDGETAAGGRLLHVMQLMEVWNVVVVVSRWFGGIKLGPDRFRIINAVGRDALVKGGFDKRKAREDAERGGSGEKGEKGEKGKGKGMGKRRQ